MAAELIINGKPTQIDTDDRRTVLEVLREDLHLTGTKYGCGEGACGACSVLVDGKIVFTCNTPLSEVVGRKITTIEGVATGEKLHPVQQAFIDHAAFQCGYCTPGMVLATIELLSKTPNPSPSDIKAQLNPHLCRCCAYERIVEAVQKVTEVAKT
jgi:aerobic-type carbon monoxide dehydrogenase small subunit (CoxS/CutS family)